MKEYFKYCSVEELKQEIKNRLSGAKIKIDEMNRRQMMDYSVDRKFYDYVSEIKCKQRQYETTINQPSELNYLLKKRRNKINQSLEKYERNIKCKTMSDFKIADYHSFHPLQFSPQHPPQLQNVCALASQQLRPGNHHTLLEKGNKLNHPRSKTEANFFNKAETQNLPNKNQIGVKNKTDKDSQCRNMRSITKVFNITVNNADLQKQLKKQEPVFTFAKTKTNEKVVKAKDLNATKKAIRFDTAPPQFLEGPETPKEQKLVDCLEPKSAKFSPQQACIKKIKERISINYQQRRQKRMTTSELHLVFEQQTSRRDALKKLVTSAAIPHF